MEIWKLLAVDPRITQTQLAKKLEVSQGTISKAVAILRRAGVVKTNRSCITLFDEVKDDKAEVQRRILEYSKKGVEYSKKNRKVTHIMTSEQESSRLGITKPSPEPSSLDLRVHRIQRSYKLLAGIDERKLTGLEMLHLNNTVQYIGKGFRITSLSLELEGIEVRSLRDVPAAMLKGAAYRTADMCAAELAEQYGLSIDLEHPYSPENLAEIELTKHELVGKVEKRGIIPLHYAADGTPDVWMDKSFGFGGFESNRTHLIQKITDMANDIVDHDGWEALKHQTLANARQIGQIAEKVDFLAENLNSHIPFLQSWNALAQAMNSPSKRARGIRIMQDTKQRRLE